MLHLQALQYRRLIELLTTAQLLDNPCLLELSLKFLEGLLDGVSRLNIISILYPQPS